jgi:hypothetical protein
MFRPLKGHLHVFLVTHYYITGLQREISVFLFTFKGHKVAALMFIYILFRDIDSSETKILTLAIKLKLILILELI